MWNVYVSMEVKHYVSSNGGVSAGFLDGKRGILETNGGIKHANKKDGPYWASNLLL